MPLLTNDEVMKTVEETLDRLDKSLETTNEQFEPQYSKVTASLSTIHNELLEQGSNGEVSVFGQLMLQEVATKAALVGEEFLKVHKKMHPSVSRIGRAIGKTMSEDVLCVFREEKNLEREGKPKTTALEMIRDYLKSDGELGLAEELAKETGISMPLTEKEIEMEGYVRKMVNHETTELVIYLEKKIAEQEKGFESCFKRNITFSPGSFSFKAKDKKNKRMSKHAQKFVWNRRDTPKLKNLKQAIHINNMLYYIQEGREYDAIYESRWLNADVPTKDLPLVMGALVRGPKSVLDPRYEHMFEPEHWQQLQAEVQEELMGNNRAALVDLLQAGVNGLPTLINMRNALANKGLFFELPVVSGLNYSHSIFKCPIMKEESSRKNLPMKLICGHVISQEALNRITTGTRCRANRMKCPYCPREQLASDAQIIRLERF